MGTVTNTIGTATRDFSTVQAWEDALPVNLVTDGNSYIGQCFNDAEFNVAAGVVTISGETTDATHTITLTTGTGQSFRDNANKLTNALRYNQANGVGLKATNLYAHTVTISVANVFLTGLQMIRTSGGNGNVVALNGTSIVPVITDCIMENQFGGHVVSNIGNTSGATLRNCLGIIRNSGNACDLNGASTYENCTIVRPSNRTAANNAFNSTAATTVTNCAGFGFSAFSGGGGTFSGNNNASDQTIGFGTSNQASKTYANQFQNSSDASGAHDFRLAASGDDCADNGATDANITDDIVGTTRPQGANPDIGCWERAASGGTTASGYIGGGYGGRGYMGGD